MTDIYEYQNKTIKEIEDLVSIAGILNQELTDKIKQLAEEVPDLKDFAERMVTWRSAIREAVSIETVDKIYSSMAKLIKSIMEENNEKEKAEIQKNTDWWKEHYRKVSENEKQEAEWWRKPKTIGWLRKK